jgi:hypothetical protein
VSKKLKELVKIIQAKKEWTVEDVAKSVGYSRVQLSRLMNQDESSDIESLLEEKHSALIQNVSPAATLIGRADVKQKSLPLDEWQAKYLAQVERENEQLRKDKEDLKRDKATLEKLVQDNQKIISISLRSLEALSKTLSVRQLAVGKTVLQSLERLEKKKPGSLIAASDKEVEEIEREMYVHDTAAG